jgi:hypothetical protein
MGLGALTSSIEKEYCGNTFKDEKAFTLLYNRWDLIIVQIKGALRAPKS